MEAGRRLSDTLELELHRVWAAMWIESRIKAMPCRIQLGKGI